MKPGEVWFAELGMAEKSRPVLLLAVPQPADARSLVIIAPLTSQIRGMRGEVDIGKPRWKLGSLPPDQFTELKAAIRDVLHL